jgi:hypothetical protein
MSSKEHAMRSRTWLCCAIVAATITACHENNPLFCEGHPSDPSCIDAGPDTPPGCTGDPQCAAPTAVCDVGAMTCVQCTSSEAGACSGTTPTCGSDDACHACTAHTDCASAACLPDGSCGTDANVAYVDPAGTDNAMCTKVTPCTKVAKALATTRPFVKFQGTTDEATTVNNGQHVTFLADPGAKLTRTAANGAILTVTGDGTSLAVFDLSISNAPNSTSGIGIVIPAASGAPTITLTRATISNDPGGGISASGGTLTLSRSTISNNDGGGVTIAGAQFDITNCFITQNGTPAGLIGGISFATVSSTGSHRLDFNTIASNTGTSTVNSGVNCGTVGVAVTFSDNIIFGNTVSGGGKQIGGSINCSTTYSDIGPDTTSGTGNLNADPMFVNVVQGNFHLMSGSPAKDAADPAATLNVDFDGDTRPHGPHSDMGADELIQ